MRHTFFLFLLVATIAVTSEATTVRAADDARPNVLFIAVDDLRPKLACYGETEIHSPNIDRLAKSGVLFQQAFCMVPTCGASRASLMTGIRPTANRFVNFLTWAEKDASDATTMNTHFKRNGYHTVSLGKIFHHPEDNVQGWSEPPWRPRGVASYRLPESLKRQQEQAGKAGKKRRGPPFESADVADNAYVDGVLAERAVADLRRLANQDEPFFLAVGFFKPHLPFVAPKKYWDLYDRDDIALPDNYHVPKDAPAESIHNSGELRAYAGIPAKGPVSDEMARNLIHGYHACVSYTDAQIGKLLDELERLSLSDNTIVVLWGDHGWNLGEHTLWCKHSCYETSMRIPLIVRAPGIDGARQTRGLTESIDLYPTLCELTGLPLPSHVQGRSFVPLLQAPQTSWKPAAIGRFRDGDTIRTDRYRFSQYTNRDGTPSSQMLYDHEVDPDENENVVNRKKQADVVKRLAKELQTGMGRDSDPAKSEK